MTATTTPDLTLYRAVHTALRRAPHRMAYVAATLRSGDVHRVRALARYWKGYAGEVLSHHTTEDEVFFPALVDRVPVAAELIARTDVEHHELDELMERTDAAMAELAGGGPADELPVVMSDLAALMDRHLDFEDADILPLFERHFSAEEYNVLDEAAKKSLPLSKQTAFTVAFILSAMSSELRREVLATAPVPLKMLHRLTRRSHARLEAAVFRAPVAPPVGVA